jgi:hypothetical protein
MVRMGAEKRGGADSVGLINILEIFQMIQIARFIAKG